VDVRRYRNLSNRLPPGGLDRDRGNAQFRGRFRQPPPKMATPADFDGNFLFCRIILRNAPYGDGGGWGVDYPRADINLTFRLSELTTTTVSRHPREEYNHVVVRLTDPLLYHCQFG
jgi:hypothetical protein